MIALRLGGRTIAEWKRSMSEKEFRRWAQFARQEPMDDQANHHYPLAALRADFINANRAANAQPVEIRDCLLFAPRSEEAVEDQLLSGDW